MPTVSALYKREHDHSTASISGDQGVEERAGREWNQRDVISWLGTLKT